MAYLEFYGAAILICLALAFAFWALSMAVRYYFDKRDFDRRLASRIRELDERMERDEH